MTGPAAGAGIPILTYHNVEIAPAGVGLGSLYVHPRRFRRQMALLARLGYRGLSMSQAMPYLRGERAGRVAAVTFDDGYADNVENALPVLLRHGFSATCYVASGEIGGYNSWDADRLGVRKPLMSDEQLRAWRDAGMEVGAHTRTHPRLSALPDREIREEVLGSRADLEDRLGVRVSQFCYPYGDHDDRIVGVVRDAGFAAATTVLRGLARPDDDPLRLPRVPVHRDLGVVRFLAKILTRYEDRRRGRAGGA
jgi:peptidoglycan/xylan/chitin deacetylase (PgdA/CDA1 family)